MVVETRPLAELTHEAIRLLYRELGVVDTVRFLRQFTLSLENYVEERDALFADKSLSEITEQIKRRRAQQ